MPIEKILIVDDELLIRDFLAETLRRKNFDVTTAENGNKAIALLKDNVFDLVITDMTMPQMTGVRLSEKLMRIRPDVPIIICTGYNAHIDEEGAKKMGVAAFVVKPIIKHEFAKTIRKAIDSKKA